MTTSIVHDFSVLYSSRVHQKDKKWSDGRLKYYEFNNKIEIVSDEGLLVCSDFYPAKAKPPLEGGIFEEGNTYTLPNGKLIVELSEYIGCTERDISKAFQKSIKKEVSVVPERPIKIQVKKEPEEKMGNIKELDKEVKVKMEDIIGNNVDGIPTETKTALSTSKGISKEHSRAILRTRTIGLTRPKRTRQSQVTPFISKLTVEEKLAKMDKKVPLKRIPPGSNKLNLRLYHELGVNVESKTTCPAMTNNELIQLEFPSAPNGAEKNTEPGRIWNVT